MTGMVMITKSVGCRGEEGDGKGTQTDEQQQNQLSLFALLISALRRSMVSCRVERHEDSVSSTHMDIGWPTNVRHITHVTFDRFNGFLGLPVEFEVEIPCRVPSASASVFGVSAESMQCSYDSKGNSVPTILLLMQERLYSQAGLKAEGIFRINPENSQEEHVRDQLNRGIVPDDIDVHCLAGLIKAWFRELPEGVLDGLSPEEVLQCNTEDESVELVKQLMPTQAALLNWAIGLMADVVEEEESNKMNARNIAMVFAPNMTQMSDPLTALMHAVQVMNLLKTLIIRTLREREEIATGGYSPFSSHSSGQHTDEDYDSHQEMMDTSCELRGPTSDYDDHANYSQSSGDEDEDEDEDGDNSSNLIEECFLRQLDENEVPTHDCPEEAEGNMGVEHLRHSGCSGFNTESAFSSSNSKYGSSGLSTSDVEDSGISEISMGELNSAKAILECCQETQDSSRAVEMLDKQKESSCAISLPVIVSGDSG
ncbi:rho GTPase-activating protein 2-like isoform X2 [Telopea speciosissima]|uniref:rho GTPase-activating protein 2-like isoform X2 n=1 Tax=Telopea speciosissima TaxID=54955 RepID=UPI001CC502ED|nr:rho GTPase-activating protein 2-like isoform X2 [Telopea speciosissima]